MPSTLVKDVIYRIQQLVNDTSPQFTSYTERELVNFINDAQLAICKLAPWASSRVDSLKLTTGQARQSIASIPALSMIPSDGSAAVAVQGVFLTDIMCNMGADGMTEGAAIRIASRSVLNTNKPNWPTVGTTTKVDQFIFDERLPKNFFVLPRPTTTMWVLAAYQALPVAIPAGGAPGAEIYTFAGASAQTITIDDRFTDDIVNYGIARCYAKASETADQAKYAAFMEMFAGSIKAHVDVMKAMNPNLVRS